MSRRLAHGLIIEDYPMGSQLEDKIKFLCRYGAIAPSVHNVQPWKFSFTAVGVIVRIDSDKKLSVSDPTGRQTWISLGCCVENIILAGEVLGISLTSIEVDEHAVALKFKENKKREDADILEAIKNRVTNRALFNKAPINHQVIKELQSIWPSKNITIKISTDPAIIEFVASATAKATQVALRMPDFKRELASLIRSNWTRKPTGIPGYALSNSLLSFLKPLEYRYLDVSKKEAALENRKQLSASGIAFIFSSGDTEKFWLEAGRAYERLVITATRLGLNHSTSAALVEAPSFHEELEAKLGVNERLQAVVRLGYTSYSPKHSPRATLNQLCD